MSYYEIQVKMHVVFEYSYFLLRNWTHFIESRLSLSLSLPFSYASLFHHLPSAIVNNIHLGCIKNRYNYLFQQTWFFNFPKKYIFRIEFLPLRISSQTGKSHSVYTSKSNFLIQCDYEESAVFPVWCRM